MSVKYPLRRIDLYLSLTAWQIRTHPTESTYLVRTRYGQASNCEVASNLIETELIM